tara:strand:+ start:1984 stop:2403 length:420 start_codon:yes stop_codon:yes gene_type:complete
MKNILIIHGPNTNLIGLISSNNCTRITLDKLNRHIRKHIRNKNVSIKIIQTNNEDKAVSYLQKNRNKFNGIVISPGVWQLSAFVLKDLLDILKKPFITVSYRDNEKVSILSGFKDIHNSNIFLAYETAIDSMIKKINND